MKNDAPKPTPIEIQKCYNLVDSSDICYKIKLTFSSDKLSNYRYNSRRFFS